MTVSGPPTTHGIPKFADADVPDLAAGGLGGILDTLDGLLGAYKVAEGALGGSAIDFQNIPATYGHLFLVCKLRCSDVSGAITVGMRFNNDSAANYEYAYGYVGNATWNQGNALTVTSGFVGILPAASSVAGRFGTLVITIPNYTDAVNHKTYDANWSCPGGSAVNMFKGAHGGAWAAAQAINRLTLIDLSGGTFAGKAGLFAHA